MLRKSEAFYHRHCLPKRRLPILINVNMLITTIKYFRPSVFRFPWNRGISTKCSTTLAAEPCRKSGFYLVCANDGHQAIPVSGNATSFQTISGQLFQFHTENFLSEILAFAVAYRYLSQGNVTVSNTEINTYVLFHIIYLPNFI